MRVNVKRARKSSGYRWRKALLASVAFLLAIPAAVAVMPQTALAAWSESFESGKATFEIVPADRSVHANIAYEIVNLDPATASRTSYYFRWSASVPSEASNIRVFDQVGTMAVTPTTGEYWTSLSINLRRDLFYGDKASFTVTYDLALPNANQADFYAWTPRGSFETSIIVPKGYYEDFSVDPKEASKQDLVLKTTYRYSFSGPNYKPVAVEGARKGVSVTRSGSVKLAQKTVAISVNMWEGEEQEAQRIVDLYVSALPVLEQLTGVPFPPDYAIKVTEATNTELKGYAGQNGGSSGIKVLWSNKTDSTLLHELAHYWADQPPWAETWMREGQASYYAVLALEKLGKTQAAADYRKYRTQEYEDGKAAVDMPLYNWETPALFTGQEDVSFGYGKSFVFMSNLQGAVGNEGLQKANQTIFTRGVDVDWLDYLETLGSAAGKDVGSYFLGWIVPADYGPLLGTYRQVKDAVAQPVDRLGIDSVEKQLTKARSDVVGGSAPMANSNLDLTMKTLAEWKGALQSYRVAENLTMAAPYELGVKPVMDALGTSRDALIDGAYSRVDAEAARTGDLFRQWQAALAAYKDADSTVSAESNSLGADFTSDQLDLAKESLMAGQYSSALTQATSAKALVPIWKDSVITLRAAEDAVSKAKADGRTWGLKKAEESLAQAQQSISNAQFDASLPLSRTATTLATHSVTPFRALLPYLAGGLLAIAAVVGAFIWLRRRKSSASV